MYLEAAILEEEVGQEAVILEEVEYPIAFPLSIPMAFHPFHSCPIGPPQLVRQV